MPLSEAQKRAQANWRAKNRERVAFHINKWKSKPENVEHCAELQRSYARKCNKRRYDLRKEFLRLASIDV